MRLSKEIQQAVVRAFKMRRFGTGLHDIKDDEGKIIGEFGVERMWIAEIDYVYIGTVTIAVIYSRSYEEILRPFGITDPTRDYPAVHKGLLLLPPWVDYQSEKNEHLKTVDITWPDPVILALKNLNLVHNSWIGIDEITQAYSLYIVRHTGWTEINHFGTTVDPSQLALWDALLEMCRQMKHAYNDEKITEFLERRNPFYPTPL